LTGFLTQMGEEEYGYIGRPVGVAVAKDGSLLIGDDANGIIYRVVYDGPQEASEPAPTKVAALPEPEAPSDLASTVLAAPGKLTVSSTFADEAQLDARYSGYSENISPEISWSKGPDGTKSYVLIMEDPGTGAHKPVVHWLMFDIPSDVTRLREGIPDDPALDDPKDAMQGMNSHGSTGYFGPKPPEGGAEHRYYFQVFALDTKLNLEPGAGRKELLEAMQGHVLAEGTLVGVYAKPPA
jgi:Raf kinase inhibitor-like YbhB/YbcL family protein